MTRRPSSDSDRAPTPASEVGLATRLLARMRQGDENAREGLARVIYEDLRSRASSMLRPSGRALLSTTELVHEAWERLDAQARVPDNRSHYLALAARMMRRVLVDLLRRTHAEVRGGASASVELSETAPASPRLDVLAVDEALTVLHELHPRQAQVVEMRFFGGMTENEVAEALDVSRRTVAGDWQIARAWLQSQFS